MRNVVITGMGITSNLGNSFPSILSNLPHASDMTTALLVKVSKNRYVDYPVHYIDRNQVNEDMANLPHELERTFTPMSLFAYQSALSALTQARLMSDSDISYYEKKKIGISVASGLPSIGTFEKLFLDTMKDNPKNMPTGDIFKTLNNNLAINLAHAFSVSGRVLSSAASCASALQSIILAYEAIQYGYADVMICGGAEEYHPYLGFIFNKLGIASNTNCKPFQKDRDGIILGEGAGILVLESEDNARNRGVDIIAEIVGTGMTFSNQASFSDSDSILECILQATKHSRIEYIDALDAHATGTPIGDKTEAEAIRKYLDLYPNTIMKTTALKGYFGHTMAACGAIELITSINLLKANKQMPVCTTEQLDTEFKDINVFTEGDDTPSVYPFILKNSFGLGGVNTSILISVR